MRIQVSHGCRERGTFIVERLEPLRHVVAELLFHPVGQQETSMQRERGDMRLSTTIGQTHGRYYCCYRNTTYRRD